MSETAKSVTNIYAAIAAVQSELHGKFVTTDEVNTGKYQYQYVSLPELLNIITPVLHKQGLVAMYETRVIDGYNVLNVRVIYIADGDYVSTAWNLGAPQQDFRTSGGHLTYYYRRLLMGLLGIHPENDETESAAPQMQMRAPQGLPPLPGNMPQMPPQQAPQYAPQSVPPQYAQTPAPQQMPQQQQHVASQPPQFRYAQSDQRPQ